MTNDKQDPGQLKKKKPGKKRDISLTRIIFLLLSFIASFFVIFVCFGADSQKDKEFSCPLSPAMQLEMETQVKTQQKLESAAALYLTRQKVKPKAFSDFINTTSSTTIAIKDLGSSVEGLDTQELKIYSDENLIGTYNLEDIIVGNQIPENSFDIERNNLNVETNKIPTKISKRGKFVYFVAGLALAAIFYIFLLRFNKSRAGIITIILIFLLFLISILTALKGQINSTVNSINDVLSDVHKPAIYLYPKKPTKVTITLDKSINIISDVPTYAQNKGWHVLAYPGSKIVDLQPEYTDCNKLNPNTFGMEYAKKACLNNNYPYIYWEGRSFDNNISPQTKGWLVKTNDIKPFLESKIEYIGFNKAEKDEFIRYWVYKVNKLNQKTVFISFLQTADIEKDFPMTVIPKPDNVNRFYILIDPNIKSHGNPAPQKLIKFKRDGYTLVDWGGMIILNRI